MLCFNNIIFFERCCFLSQFGQRQTRNIIGGKYYWELQDWVNQLFMKYNRCLVCGSKNNLEPHHITQVKPYDKLYSSVNNGAVLCKDCHRKYHEEYNGNVNPVSLVEFTKTMNKPKKKVVKSDCNDLVKKYKKLKKVEKYYREETFRLRDELGLSKNGYFKKDELNNE